MGGGILDVTDDLLGERNRMNKSSMLYWWPRIKGLPIPQPKTIIVPVSTETMAKTLDGDIEGMLVFEPQFRAAAEELGYPLFLRTDQMSGKHEYERTCFVPSPDELLRHIGALIEYNFIVDMFGPGPSAIVFREFITLAACFHAFEGLPIAPERRYFVRGGQVQCHHPYWPADAIRNPSTRFWKSRLNRMNEEFEEEIILLSGYAETVGACLPGYWSVDFALAADGRWLLIDCAKGEESWHPNNCDYSGDS
jgi:hypothetical protein